MSKKAKQTKNVRKRSGAAAMTPAKRAYYDTMRGNTRALQHGLYSAKVQSGALTDAALAQGRETVAAIVEELGGAAQVSTLKHGLIRRYAALSFVADHLEGHLASGGVLSTTGRTRSATTTYLSVLDRLARLSLAIGIERKPKPVGDLETFLQQRGSVAPAASADTEEHD